jgi:hypothetical protein
MNDILAAHKHSSRHRAEIMSSNQCGCFDCLEIFVPSEVQDWVDWPKGTPDDLELESGMTALCPFCGIDSVVGTSSGFPVNSEFLRQMRKHWFNE